MGDIFKALSGGVARFVLGWILPTAITLGVFVILVLPDVVRREGSLRQYSLVSSNGWIELAAFALATFTLAVLFAYCSLPLYRVLEGYTLPRKVKRTLIGVQLRKWQRLKARAELSRDRTDRQLAFEKLQNYPSSAQLILPTRLGNTLRAMEMYGKARFGLDSQTLWYELQASTSPALRRDIEDGRASVDFFVSSIAHLASLAVASGAVALWIHSLVAGTVTAVSLLLIYPAYLAAVHNVGEWRNTVRAAVNTGRQDLADSLLLRLPTAMEDEVLLWRAVTNFVAHGPDGDRLDLLNRYRQGSVVKRAGPTVAPKRRRAPRLTS